MGLISTAVATTIGSVTSLAPVPVPSPDSISQLIVLPSQIMPSAGIAITQLAFAENVEHVWHNVSWDALASSTEELYVL